MNLQDYINQCRRSERAALMRSIAEALGVTIGAVQHWSSGKRLISAPHAVALEKFLKGSVRREEMRPDLFK